MIITNALVIGGAKPHRSKNKNPGRKWALDRGNTEEADAMHNIEIVGGQIKALDSYHFFDKVSVRAARKVSDAELGFLRQNANSYARYYNEMRTHRSLDKDAPISRPVQRTGSIMSHALLGGLHHHYIRV